MSLSYQYSYINHLASTSPPLLLIATSLEASYMFLLHDVEFNSLFLWSWLSACQSPADNMVRWPVCLSAVGWPVSPSMYPSCVFPFSFLVYRVFLSFCCRARFMACLNVRLSVHGQSFACSTFPLLSAETLVSRWAHIYQPFQRDPTRVTQSTITYVSPAYSTHVSRQITSLTATWLLWHFTIRLLPLLPTEDDIYHNKVPVALRSLPAPCSLSIRGWQGVRVTATK